MNKQTIAIQYKYCGRGRRTVAPIPHCVCVRVCVCVCVRVCVSVHVSVCLSCMSGGENKQGRLLRKIISKLDPGLG